MLKKKPWQSNNTIKSSMSTSPRVSLWIEIVGYRLILGQQSTSVEHSGDRSLQDQKHNNNGKVQSLLIPVTMEECHYKHHTETKVVGIINDCVFPRKVKKP